MKANKLDAALVSAMRRPESSELRFDVTVRVALPLQPAQLSQLAGLGVVADLRRTIFTADLDKAALGPLSEADCVVRISLAQALRPLNTSPGQPV